MHQNLDLLHVESPESIALTLDTAHGMYTQ